MHLHIIRHGQALHNVQRGYPYRDPPLTNLGRTQASEIHLPAQPDLVLVSPMTRTLETLEVLLEASWKDVPTPEIKVSPELREAYNAECHKGSSLNMLRERFPHFDFSDCHEEWDYEAFSEEEAIARATRVAKAIADFLTSGKYERVVLISHRGFISYLMSGTPDYKTAEAKRSTPSVE